MFYLERAKLRWELERKMLEVKNRVMAAWWCLLGRSVMYGLRIEKDEIDTLAIHVLKTPLLFYNCKFNIKKGYALSFKTEDKEIVSLEWRRK